MSEPLRYLAKCPWYSIELQAHPKGEFVLYSDYARLKAENERSVEQYNSIIDQQLAEIYRLKAEVERLTKAMEWQPIETAPMDGTDILCFCIEPEFEGEENPWTEFRVCFYGAMTEDYACWMSHYGYEQRPTHWMPLPKPPAAKDGKPTE